MKRRTFLLGAAALALAPRTGWAVSKPIYPEGYLDKGDFVWSNGGGNPLKLQPKDALGLKRLGLHSRVQAGLLQAMTGIPENFDLRDHEGRVIGDVMIGGKGVLRPRTKPITTKWKKNRSTKAKAWGWVDLETGDRYRIIVAEVCDNILITRWGKPIVCTCDAEKGDACSS